MAGELTILHLSDIQFGRNHRYPNGQGSYQTLFAKLSQDLDHLATTQQLKPTALVVSGDVAECSLPDEYVAARELLDQLAAKLRLGRERIVIIPGNHDVHWKLCEAGRLRAEAYGKPFEPPFFSKFEFYQRFFNDFYDGVQFFDENQLFHFYPLVEEKVLLVGFNSCMHESEKPDEHYGWIGVEQVQRAVERCHEIDPDLAWLRIAVMHHNFLGGSNLDNENLRDRDEILPLLEEGRFRLLLHGHRHIAEVKQLGSVNKDPIKIVAAGSAGLDAEALPDHPNQYQIIKIVNGNDVTLTMRQFSAQTIGLSGKGKFTADTSVDESGVVRFQLAHAPPAPRPRARRSATLADARKRFLQYVREEHRFLPLRGFGTELRAPIELEPIYVSLRAVPSHVELESRRKREAELTPLDEMEIGPGLQFCEKNCFSGMVILGDPGSGKTTLLKYVALCLAQSRSVKETGIKTGRVPLYLPLRGVTDFSTPLVDALRACYARLGLPGDFFAQVLDSGRCMLLLDGLDEVATLSRRKEAGEWIEAERKQRPKNLIVLTSRFAGYKGEARLPGNYLEMHVRDFRPEDVRRFVEQWYRQVETKQRGDTQQWRDEARRLSEDLIWHLAASEALTALARNPLMLQIICLVHRTQGTMPKRRTELYEECIKVLLQKWDEAKGLEVYLSASEARQVLRPLALWLHGEEGRTYADRDEVKEVLRPHLARVKRDLTEVEEQLDRILTSVRDRSGLFVGFDVERYGFHHLSFQEFLAAEEIAKQGLHQQLVDTFGRSWWREPTLLALGLDDPRFQQAFFEALIRSPQFTDNLDFALASVRESLAPAVAPFRDVLADENIDWRVRYNCVLLLRELGGPEAIETLCIAVRDSRVEVRSAAADALVQLGAVDKFAVPVEVLGRLNTKDGTDLIRIPAGDFLMGSNDGPNDERPQRTVHLPEYYIGKNPVTNAQYARFIEATGHEKPTYWNDKRFNQPNQPVVTVTWRDALAYCQWAGLRLPTEAEWEKAARGSDGRQWPWGNDAPDEKRCNFADKIGTTSEVGSYPDGASPYGCLDMAGNVWEWCATKSYDKPPDDSLEGDASRVLRGGAYWSDADSVRCASRHGNYPVHRTGLIGFRVAQ